MRRSHLRAHRFAIPATAFWSAAVFAAFAVGCGHLGSVTPTSGSNHGFARRAPDGVVAQHVLTWTDADRTAPYLVWTTVTPYVNYAIVGQSQSDVELAADIGSAGIGVVEYTDPNRQVQIDGPHFPDNLPSDYAYDCTPNRIYRKGFGSRTPPPPQPTPTPIDHAMYLMDPHSAHLAGSWANEVIAFAQSTGTTAYVFEDTADSISDMDAQPCGFSQTDWSAASNGMDATMTAQAAAAGDNVSLIYNGLGVYTPAPGFMPPALALNATSAGGMAEDCYARQPPLTRAHPDPTPVPVADVAWAVTEDVEAYMSGASKVFVCNAKSDLTTDAAQLTDLRTYVMSSFLLTYDPATSVLDEQFRPVSTFSVFPESEILALDPLVPEPAQISQLQVGGVYARQYAACYIAAQPIGPCASVVNPSSTTTYRFPFPGVYLGVLRLKGGGVLDTGARIEQLTGGGPYNVSPTTGFIVYGVAASPSPAPSPSATPMPSPSPSPTPSPTPSPLPSRTPVSATGF